MTHAHHHHHHHGSTSAHGGDRKLIIAIGINVVLTVAQIIGGVFSGSLALIADAIHNLSDAAALAIALIARRIAYCALLAAVMHAAIKDAPESRRNDRDKA